MPQPFGVIIDEETLAAVPFFSYAPPKYSQSAVYFDQDIRGRSEPHVFYDHTTPQIWQFAITLAVGIGLASELPIPGLVAAVLDYGNPAAIRIAENLIRSLVYPDYGVQIGSDGVVKAPHIARIAINAMFDARGTIRNLSVEYPPPYDIATGLPFRIEMTFDLYTQNKTPRGYTDIILNKPSLI